MDEFASLEDAFEYKPTGVAVQDEFASLEDAFDYKANFAEAEVVTFDIREFSHEPGIVFHNLDGLIRRRFFDRASSVGASRGGTADTGYLKASRFCGPCRHSEQFH